MKCERCVFYNHQGYVSEVREEDGLGYCQRYPPSHLLNSINEPFMFPIVWGIYWCGEFKK